MTSRPLRPPLLAAALLLAAGMPAVSLASVTAFASATHEAYDSGASWMDRTADLLWRGDQQSWVVGTYQRQRDGMQTETGYRLSYDRALDATTRIRLSGTSAPDAITLARQGLSTGLVRQLASGGRLEAEGGVRQWRDLTLREGQAVYFTDRTPTSLHAGLRVASAKGQSALAVLLGVSHTRDALTLGAQAVAGQGLADRSVTATHQTYHLRGGQLNASYTLASRTTVRAITARHFETLGWKSTNALVVSHAFD